MITADDFHINETKVIFKGDEYPLSKIKAARTKVNTLKDHAMRIATIGLIVSSVVWTVCPEYFGLFTAPISLVVGILLALSTARKYEIQIQFQHNDETGLQWVSIARSNKQNVKGIFEEQVVKINKNVT